MSRMRLTMIVHSVGGDREGQQECVMQTVELPDSVADGGAADGMSAHMLLAALTNHVEDELKFMRDRKED